MLVGNPFEDIQADILSSVTCTIWTDMGKNVTTTLLAGSQFLDPDGWFPNHVSMHAQHCHMPCSMECLSGSLAENCSIHWLPHGSASPAALLVLQGASHSAQSAAAGSPHCHAHMAQLSSACPAPCSVPPTCLSCSARLTSWLPTYMMPGK